MDVIIQKIHQLTPTIRAFELVAANGTELPSFEAGAHIDVHLKNGLTRQYSLSNCCTEKHRYVIGVYMMPIHAVAHVASTLNIVKVTI